MIEKKLPFTKEKIDEISKKYETPFFVYSEKDIVENALSLKKAFSWNKGFKEFFAVKATPNPYIMKILYELGFGMDCSSMGELVLCEKIGIKGEDIMFTSNNTPAEEFIKAKELGAIINLDDITHIDFLEKNAGIPEIICFRYNPGREKTGNGIIGSPEEAKFGLTREQMIEAYSIMKDKGVKRFGIHTMVASNELEEEYFLDTAKMVLNLVDEIESKVGIKFMFVNIGGGIGIPYMPTQKRIELDELGKDIKKIFLDRDINLYMEMGRMITGPYGFLVTKAIHEKHIYKEYIGVDASMSALMRPGMYGAYHHITVLGKEEAKKDRVYDIVGSLCENNDKFAINRNLPTIDIGDFLVIHDAGAHGHSMGFNYNAKLRPAELLMKEDGSIKMIRRAEDLNDYFATLDFSEF